MRCISTTIRRFATILMERHRHDHQTGLIHSSRLPVGSFASSPIIALLAAGGGAPRARPTQYGRYGTSARSPPVATASLACKGLGRQQELVSESRPMFPALANRLKTGQRLYRQKRARPVSSRASYERGMVCERREFAKRFSDRVHLTRSNR